MVSVPGTDPELDVFPKLCPHLKADRPTVISWASKASRVSGLPRRQAAWPAGAHNTDTNSSRHRHLSRACVTCAQSVCLTLQKAKTQNVGV